MVARILTLFAGLAILVATFWRFTPAHILFTNDLAVSVAVAAEQLAGHTVLVGPPSHEGARHLGPIYYWFVTACLAVGRLAASWSASSNFGNASLAGSTLLSETYYAILIMVILKLLSYTAALNTSLSLISAPSRRATIGLLLATIVISFQLPIFRIPWHSNDVIIPVSLSWIFFIRSLRLGWKEFPKLAISAFAASLWHFASIPYAVGLVAGAALALRKTRGNPHLEDFGDRRTRLYTGALFAIGLTLLITPAIAFELLGSRNNPGNISSWIAHHLLQNSGSNPVEGGSKLGLGGAALLLINFVALQLGGILQSPGQWSSTIWLYFIGLALLVGCVISLTRNSASSNGSDPLETKKWVIRSAILTISLYVIASSRLRAPAFEYFLNPLLPVLMTLIALALETSSEAGLRSLSLRSASVSQLLASLLIPTYLFVIMLTAPASLRHQLPFPMAPQASLLHASEVASTIASDIAAEDRSRMMITGPGFWEELRENGVYYFLGRRFYPLMQYSQFFTELSAFVTSKPRLFSLTDGQTKAHSRSIYSLSCQPGTATEQGEDLKLQEKINRLLAWQEKVELPLTACSTCSGCRLLRYRQRL